MACLAEACVVSGAAPDACRCTTRCCPTPSATSSPAPSTISDPWRTTSECWRHSCRRWDDAERHFADATRQSEALAARPHLARVLVRRRACAWPAQRLAIARQRQTRSQRALAIARPLGMQALCERLEALHAAVGRRRGAAARRVGVAAPGRRLLDARPRWQGLSTARQQGPALSGAPARRAGARVPRPRPGRLPTAHSSPTGRSARCGKGRPTRCSTGAPSTPFGAGSRNCAPSSRKPRATTTAAAPRRHARDRRAHRAARHAVGLGGRDRAVGAVAERARSSVTKALRNAIRLDRRQRSGTVAPADADRAHGHVLLLRAAGGDHAALGAVRVSRRAPRRRRGARHLDLDRERANCRAKPPHRALRRTK